ncbi:MAG: GspH/FimT family pseudopilin [Ketobacteraceae bacterium]|nr:GspH/FimT family pseudopilin [Ketobacteraceae bacterium]
MSQIKNQQGFTMVELMITLAIAGMLLAVGVPSMRAMIQVNKVAAESRAMVTALNYARSEAVTRKRAVSVVPTDGSNWTNGLTVWLDANGDGSVDNNDAETLQVFPDLDDIALTPSGAFTEIRFDEDGFLESPATAPSFALQLTDCNKAGVRTIVVNLSGRVEVERAACS